jgi:hypothetical protein
MHMKAPYRTKSPFVVAALLAGLALSGCGQQTFAGVNSQQNSDAPGSMAIAPKVDILLAVDNTGATFEIQQALNVALRRFLTDVQAQNWDFRIAAIPLTGSASISQIAASKYDANWEAGWVAPYPGAPKKSTIPKTMFVRPDHFSVSFTPSNRTQGMENGLSQIANVLNQSGTKSYFLRPEALTAVVVISNGEDTSNGTYEITPGQLAPNPTVSATILNSIRNVKGSALADSVRLFSVVNTAGGRVSNCLGDMAFAGNRYVSAAQSLGGRSYDLCRNQLSNVLTVSLKADLQAIKLNYVKRFVLIASQPNLATVRVTKHLENGSQVVVPESANGSPGWKYLGQASVPMISEPIEMDFRTGYAIQLIGNQYKLTGGEYVSIEYLPYGIQDSQ